MNMETAEYMTAKPKKKAYHHGNLKETLIDTAYNMLSVITVDELSLRALAREAGVSQTAPYRHFESKEELLLELRKRGFEQFSEEMKGALKGIETPQEQLCQIGITYVEFAKKYPAYFNLMFEYMYCDQHQIEGFLETSNDAYLIFSETVQAVLALRDEDDPVDLLSAETSCWALVQGLCGLRMKGVLARYFSDENAQDVLVRQTIRLQSELLLK